MTIIICIIVLCPIDPNYYSENKFCKILATFGVFLLLLRGVQ